MKHRHLISIVFFLLCSCSPRVRTDVYVANRPQPPIQQAPVQTYQQNENNFQVFYDELAPYGTWMNYPDYGYVWRPNVGPDFKPYRTNGHWVYSDEGWTWVSNYPWGWAAFHYGRWFYENGYGWLWLPGHQWAPAWVTWGRSGDYYGWAAIEPQIEVDIHTGGGWTPPANSWNFVPSQHITKPDVENYVVVNNNKTVINNITKNVTIINNVNNSHITNVTSNNVVNNHVVNNNVVNNNSSNNRVNTTVVNNNVSNNHVNNNVVNNNVSNNHESNNVVNNNVSNNRVNSTVVNNTVSNNNNATNEFKNRMRTNIIYNRGPVVNEVEAKTQSKINSIPIQENNKPNLSHVVDNKLIIYRPVITKPGNEHSPIKPAPKKVENFLRRPVLQ